MEDTELTVSEGVERVTERFTDVPSRPDLAWVRGKCPECGDDLVSEVYYVNGRGYLCVWACWTALRDESIKATDANYRPRCKYKKVL